MSALETLERDFQAFVLEGAPAIRREVKSTSKADRDILLAVYREGYALRLIEAMAETYSALKLTLGDEGFGTAARAYIAQHRSRYYSIRWYGERLAEFLKANAPWSARPELAELAAFEWAFGEVLDAADAEPLPIEEVARLAPEQWAELRVRAVPSLRRLDLAYQIPQAWQQIDRDQRAPESFAFAGPPIPWVLWRSALVVQFRSLETDESAALDTLLAGESFATTCERLLAWHSEEAVALRAAGLLRLWLEQGMLAEVIAP